MKPNTEILEKLRKILTLANDRGAQPGEVEAAMAKAKELAIRHSIELSSVSLDDENEKRADIEIEKDSTLRTKSKYKQPYHRWIFHVLQKVFGVSVIESSSSWSGGTMISAIHIVGEPVDVAIAVAIFPYLEKVFPATLSKAVSSGRLTYCAAHTNGCYRGIYQGIVDANLREEEKLEAVEKNQYAMVVREKEGVVKAAVEEMFPNLKSTQGREIKQSWEALSYGRAAGSRINLRQVSGSRASSTLK